MSFFIEETSRPTLELTLTPFEQPLEVDMERFFEFSFDLAEDLLDLESQFKPGNQDRSRLRQSINAPAKR